MAAEHELPWALRMRSLQALRTLLFLLRMEPHGGLRYVHEETGVVYEKKDIEQAIIYAQMRETNR